MTTGDGRPDPADPPGDDGPTDDADADADAPSDRTHNPDADSPSSSTGDGRPGEADGSGSDDPATGVEPAGGPAEGSDAESTSSPDAETAAGHDSASGDEGDTDEVTERGAIPADGDDGPDPAPNGGVQADDRPVGDDAAAPKSTSASAPAPVPGTEPGDGSTSPVQKFRHAEEGPWRLARELVVNLAIVGLVGLLLFGVSGVWPPMVAVESGSMEPHMSRGDLVFVTAPDRFPPGAGDGSGIVTYRAGQDAGYRSFGEFGSVIVFDNPQRGGPPVIHRARFYVEAGENWYGRANAEYMTARNCAELAYCPAPHAGYITKGDNNSRYDQVSDISGPVKPSWITGVARLRIPFLGWIRLLLSWLATPAVAGPGLATGVIGATLLAGPRGRESARG
jgi:signal peptidase